MPLPECAPRRNAVYLFSLVGDVKTIRPHEKILLRKQLAVAIMHLPCQLNEARPVVKIGYRSGLVVGYARGFGVKNQVHRTCGCGAKLVIGNWSLVMSHWKLKTGNW